MDFVIASLMLLVLCPLLLIIAVLVRCVLGAPVLFKQVRPGLHGRIFTLFKFRSMSSDRDKNGTLLSDAERLGRFGRWLRSTSLDELPELWNIVRGDMSIVGPRPLLVEYLPLYSEWQRRRHVMKPGLTGWAQINGRNAMSWEERLELDVWYVDNWSLSLDCRILVRTIEKVVTRDGISAEGHATMTRFTGDTK